MSMALALLLVVGGSAAAATASTSDASLQAPTEVAVAEWHGAGLESLLRRFSELEAEGAPLVMVDRHVEKNGGFSMHSAMERSTASATAALNCSKLFGYQVYDEHWNEMAALLKEGKSVCVDGHSPVAKDWLTRARRLVTLAATPGNPSGPRVLTTLRIRNPTDHYHSLFEWDQVPRMAKGWAENKTLVEFIGFTPDLQANILLDSNRAVSAQHRKGATEPLSESECVSALATAADVDLLTTTEKMDDFWPVLRKLTGFELPVEHIHEAPKTFGCCGPHISLMVDEVEEATRKMAPCDWKLYEMAQRSTAKLLTEWDEFPEAVA